MSDALLAQLLAEQAAGWSTVTPAAVPRPVIVVATAPLSDVDLRHARDARQQSARRRLVTADRGDLRTREHMSPNYTYESRARRAKSSSYPHHLTR